MLYANRGSGVILKHHKKNGCGRGKVGSWKGVMIYVASLVVQSMVVGEVERTEERMAFILVCVVLAQLQIQLLHPVKQSRRPRGTYEIR